MRRLLQRALCPGRRGGIASVRTNSEPVWSQVCSESRRAREEGWLTPRTLFMGPVGALGSKAASHVALWPPRNPCLLVDLEDQ